jgi:hypothetical protein
MSERTKLSGRYKILNEALLREKSCRDDPRKPFYNAMLRNQTYEGYLAEVRGKLVEVDGYKANPISGRMEILYCRRSGWIADAK